MHTETLAVGGRIPHKKRCLEYDTKLNLMVRLHFFRPEECGIALHYHYFQVHSVREW